MCTAYGELKLDEHAVKKTDHNLQLKSVNFKIWGWMNLVIVTVLFTKANVIFARTFAAALMGHLLQSKNWMRSWVL